MCFLSNPLSWQWKDTKSPTKLLLMIMFNVVAIYLSAKSVLLGEPVSSYSTRWSVRLSTCQAWCPASPSHGLWTHNSIPQGQVNDLGMCMSPIEIPFWDRYVDVKGFFFFLLLWLLSWKMWIWIHGEGFSEEGSCPQPEIKLRNGERWAVAILCEPLYLPVMIITLLT